MHFRQIRAKTQHWRLKASCPGARSPTLPYSVQFLVFTRSNPHLALPSHPRSSAAQLVGSTGSPPLSAPHCSPSRSFEYRHWASSPSASSIRTVSNSRTSTTEIMGKALSWTQLYRGCNRAIPSKLPFLRVIPARASTSWADALLPLHRLPRGSILFPEEPIKLHRAHVATLPATHPAVLESVSIHRSLCPEPCRPPRICACCRSPECPPPFGVGDGRSHRCQPKELSAARWWMKGALQHASFLTVNSVRSNEGVE